MKTAEEFWARVNKTDSCWLWMGAKTGAGYASIWWRGERWRGHRLAWVLSGKVDPGKHYLCHKCDVPHCVNPAHLFMGTQSDNMQDCLRKGRFAVNQYARQTHCNHGHPFDQKNTRWYEGYRYCRACAARQGRERRKALKLPTPQAKGDTDG